MKIVKIRASRGNLLRFVVHDRQGIGNRCFSCESSRRGVVRPTLVRDFSSDATTGIVVPRRGLLLDIAWGN